MKRGRNAFDYDFAATVLIDAYLTSVDEACGTHEVSRQTIHNYHKKLQSDPKLLEIFTNKKAKIEVIFDPPAEPSVAELLASVRGFLMRATKEAFAFSPDCITAIATAYGIVSDKDMARQTLEVYLDALRDENRSAIGGQVASTTQFHPIKTQA